MRWRVLAAAALAALLLAGCGGGGAPKTDADAVAQVLKDAAKAAAGGDAEKACGYLTPDAQRQIILQTSAAALGTVDCATAVKGAVLTLSPIEKHQIESLQPSGISVNGTSASATMSTTSGVLSGQQPISVQLQLQKVGTDWKISGFVNEQGVPGG